MGILRRTTPLALALALAACATPAPEPAPPTATVSPAPVPAAPESPLGWLLGRWRGEILLPPQAGENALAEVEFATDPGGAIHWTLTLRFRHEDNRLSGTAVLAGNRLSMQGRYDTGFQKGAPVSFFLVWDGHSLDGSGIGAGNQPRPARFTKVK